MQVHRLSVDGKDYFLPHPVDDLKASILAAIQAGGGYVHVPPLRAGAGIDILFSPGMPVTWAQIDVGDPVAADDATHPNIDDFGDVDV